MALATKMSVALAVWLLWIHFIQPAKKQNEADQPNDIFKHYPASAEVQAIVKKACYDCHSNNTKYPCYTNIQPLGWWINNHVVEGKGELNFSEFATYKAKRANHKLEEVAEQLAEHEMPLSSYTFIHQEARLTDAEQQLLIDWAKSTRAQITVPAESDHD